VPIVYRSCSAVFRSRVIDLLQYDLACDSDIVPHAQAVDLAREFLDSVPGARFYSNGT
jgi:hypothetical protein